MIMRKVMFMLMAVTGLIMMACGTKNTPEATQETTIEAPVDEVVLEDEVASEAEVQVIQ
jgi:hypothetical protein